MDGLSDRLFQPIRIGLLMESPRDYYEIGNRYGIFMKWVGYDSRSEIVRYTNWKSKDSLLPDQAGVYILADRNHNVKYVGKAGAGRLNVEAKSAMKNRNKGRGASLIKALITNSDSKAKSLEIYLIRKYKPSNNINLYNT